MRAAAALAIAQLLGLKWEEKKTDTFPTNFSATRGKEPDAQSVSGSGTKGIRQDAA